MPGLYKQTFYHPIGDCQTSNNIKMYFETFGRIYQTFANYFDEQFFIAKKLKKKDTRFFQLCILTNPNFLKFYLSIQIFILTYESKLQTKLCY